MVVEKTRKISGRIRSEPWNHENLFYGKSSSYFEFKDNSHIYHLKWTGNKALVDYMLREEIVYDHIIDSAKIDGTVCEIHRPSNSIEDRINPRCNDPKLEKLITRLSDLESEPVYLLPSLTFSLIIAASAVVNPPRTGIFSDPAADADKYLSMCLYSAIPFIAVCTHLIVSYIRSRKPIKKLSAELRTYLSEKTFDYQS